MGQRRAASVLRTIRARADRGTVAGQEDPARAVVSYDNFSLAPDLEDAYVAVVSNLAQRYYGSRQEALRRLERP